MFTLEELLTALATLPELTSEQLAELRANAVALFKATDGEAGDLTEEITAELEQIADGLAQIDTQIAAVDELAKAREARAEAARAAVADPEEETEETTEGDETDAEGTEGAETPAEDEGAEAPEAVAASAPAQVVPIRHMRSPATTRPKTGTPEVDPEMPRQRIVASIGGGARNNPVPAGGEITGDVSAQIAEKMDNILASMQHGGGNGELVTVASFITEYPEDRQVSSRRTAQQNAEILDRWGNKQQSLVAAGGLSLPLPNDYNLQINSSARRPLLDGLPSVGADRGGLNYNVPPTLAALLDSTGVWTEANDQSPSSPSTKAKHVLGKPTVLQTRVDAIPSIVQAGNYSKFQPEWVEANLKMAMVAWAQTAELNLLKAINAGSDVASSTGTLGATRELMAVISRSVAAFRWTRRIDEVTALTAIFPLWVKNIIRSDMARSLSTGSTQLNMLEITDAQIEGWFRNVGITKVIWLLDGTSDVVAGSANQNIAAVPLGTANAVPAYPVNVSWNLYAEGCWERLDAGLMNLGVVRDSTLNSTNDYQLFQEIFEQAIKRDNQSLRIISTVSATGAFAAGV